MRNKNLWILLAAAALIAVVFVAAQLMKPAPAAITEDTQAFMLIRVDGKEQEPIPLTGEGERTITHADGSSNTVRFTPTSIWMASATCDNQDCVEQGVVSLDTMDSRVLGNMIICLPQRVTLELYTAGDMQALNTSMEETAP